MVVTIHQPSTSVFATFDQLLLLSEGRTAYRGEAAKATDYFAKLDHPLPPLTNPADFRLDLVNSDFVDKKEVTRLLDAWASAHTNGAIDVINQGEDDNWGLTPTLCNTFVPVFRRQSTLLSRDVLTLGIRAVCFLMGNLYFSAVYVESRQRHQDQVANRFWLIIWYIGVPAQVTALLVFALNLEARIVRTEVANGMVAPSADLAASVLEIPLVIFLALVALGLPAFACMNFMAGDRFFTTTALFFAQQYCWDCYASCLAVAFPNPWWARPCSSGAGSPVSCSPASSSRSRTSSGRCGRSTHALPLGNAARGMTYSEFIDSKYDACDNYDARHVLFLR